MPLSLSHSQINACTHIRWRLAHWFTRQCVMWSVTFPSAPADGMKGAETPTMQEHLSGEMSVIRAQLQKRSQAKSLHRHKDTDTNSEDWGPWVERMRVTGDLLYTTESQQWRQTSITHLYCKCQLHSDICEYTEIYHFCRHHIYSNLHCIEFWSDLP